MPLLRQALNRYALLMTNFQFLENRQINQNYQGVCLSRFSLKEHDQIKEATIIDSFIHSRHFALESRCEVVHNNSRAPSLRPAFNMEQISVDHFRKLEKPQLATFFQEMEDADDWGVSDKDDFIAIKSQFLHEIDVVQTSSFYVLSIDWFAGDDIQVVNPEFWVYSFYFLVIWIEPAASVLTVSEWTYD